MTPFPRLFALSLRRLQARFHNCVGGVKRLDPEVGARGHNFVQAHDGGFRPSESRQFVARELRGLATLAGGLAQCASLAGARREVRARANDYIRALLRNGKPS